MMKVDTVISFHRKYLVCDNCFTFEPLYYIQTVLGDSEVQNGSIR